MSKNYEILKIFTSPLSHVLYEWHWMFNVTDFFGVTDFFVKIPAFFSDVQSGFKKIHVL